MRRRTEWIAITLVTLLAAALRLWALGAIPPGLAHDEVANWLIARDILAGRQAIYFTAAYGHEPLYQYAQAATVALFGDHWLGLRYPSVAFGLLGLAATYVLIRRLFGGPVALLSGGWLAMSFWPLFYARVALRAITLPFTAALSVYFLARATNLSATHAKSTPRLGDWLLAGLFLGLSLYTYMAARILPIILPAFLVYAFIIRPSSSPSRTPVPWSRILLFLLTAVVISAPLMLWLATHPGAEDRIAEVREPLDRLFDGDPSLVWQNLVANLKFFSFAGDPWPRQNLPGRPVFADPISAVLFYAGVLIALFRWRDPRYGLLLLWLGGALVPSIATAVAPSSIRNVLGLVVVFVFPALALVEAVRFLRLTLHSLLPTPYSLLPASCILLLTPCLFLTVRDYFLTWPRHDVVRFDYQTDLSGVARRLDELPLQTPVAVAGLSVHTMDGPGLKLAARRDVRGVRLCDTRETLVVPARSSDGGPVWLFVPQVVPLDPDLQERLLRWGAVMEIGSQSSWPAPTSFVGYRVPGDAELRRRPLGDLQRLETAASLPDGTPVTLPISFGESLALVGYERLQQCTAPGDLLALLTYWHVETSPSTPLKTFVHLLGGSETPIAQHDGLGSPPQRWAAGDLVVQKHTIPIPDDLAPGQYQLQMGLYDPTTNARLPVSAADRLLIYPLEVTECRNGG
jgi:4-amino-4-deoxy-L-arabinose transferase-like glycosyltransferase